MDITDTPMAKGFVYLAAVIDWATRRVLAQRVSITMAADCCIAAVEEAIAHYGAPDIRLWRTIKYAEVCLNAYERVSHARASLARFIVFYNTCRAHSALDAKTPDEVYFANPADARKAA